MEAAVVVGVPTEVKEPVWARMLVEPLPMKVTAVSL